MIVAFSILIEFKIRKCKGAIIVGEFQKEQIGPIWIGYEGNTNRSYKGDILER